MIEVEIDKDSGFCFGVVTAIESAERELGNTDTLYCLGDIVHNSLEVERLEYMGLHTIDHDGLSKLRDRKVLLRAHGEPPSTYSLAKRNNITIIDATCPVVLRLQRKIHKCYQETRANNTQLVIYGKKGHAEVNGLVGQTEGTAIVIEKIEDLDRLDFTRAISLFSQTTKSLDGFKAVVAEIKQRMAEGVEFNYYDTICRQVANRLPNIKAFASSHDWVYFVAGRKSSNGKMLFEECRKANPNTLFISEVSEITEPLPEGVRRVGVCGATSTPKWLMEEVAVRINDLLCMNLEIAGYETVGYLDGNEAYEAIIQDHAFQCALVDIMLPGRDGYSLLPKLKQYEIPVIFLTAKGDIASKIKGLKDGAEDYIVKPFEMLEVMVRLEKVLERNGTVQEQIQIGDVIIDTASRTVTKMGMEIYLKPMEYNCLMVFAKNPNKALTRNQILQELWNEEFCGETRTVDAHVGRIRKKLGWQDKIKTIPRIGYRLEVDL